MGSRAEIEAHQVTLLRSQLERLTSDASRPYFRKRLASHGLGPDTLRSVTDLTAFPITTKADLRDDEAVNPPYGSYNSSDLSRYVRVQATSGTTGTPTHIFWTRDDIAGERRMAAHGLARTGMTAADVVSHAYPFGTFEAGEISVNVSQAVEELGALCIPVGSPQNTDDAIRHLRYWQQVGVTYVHFWGPLLTIYEDAAASGDISLADDLRISRLLVAEPAVQFTEPREMVQRRWGGCEVFTLYGAKEFQAFLATDCANHDGLHITEDSVLVEIVDRNGQPLPPGQRGRILMTSLYRDTALLRYETGDYGWFADGTCGCGDPSRRLFYEGRADEMCIDASGAVFFPLAVHRAIARVVSAYKIDVVPSFEIVRDATTKRALSIVVELGDELSGSAAQIQTSLREVEGVQGVPAQAARAGTLTRSTFKLMRVHDV